MTAVSSSIERAGDELADIHKEVYRLEKRIETVREVVRRAVEERSVSERRASSRRRSRRDQFRSSHRHTEPYASATLSFGSGRLAPGD